MIDIAEPVSELAEDPELLVMAGVAGSVATLALLRPRLLLRILLIDPDELSGAARLALGLFATRNVWIVARSLRGDRSARQAYLQLQALDQVVFWSAAASGAVRTRSAAIAATVSGVIIIAGARRQRRLGH